MSDVALIEDRKLLLDSGAIVQIKIWQLPETTEERPHGLKYSLFYGYPGERVVGYDNEAGKGDHRHYREREEPYQFTTYQTLLADFWQDVKKEIERERS
ncbi:MAG: DUF6516 family protein [Halioglobus sp.]|nr:DUF6516 family protein [Halioglobus sp.]